MRQDGNQKRGWTPDERKKLKQLTIDSARHTRADLLALIAHFKNGGGISSVVDNAKPVYKSQDFARKVKRLTEEGELDWLDANQSEAPAGQLTETSRDVPENAQATPSGSCAPVHDVYVAETEGLLGYLAQSLAVPSLTDLLRERSPVMDEFFATCEDSPGGQWYVGPQARDPVLKAETMLGFSLLRQSTSTWEFWRELDEFRPPLGEYIQAGMDHLTRISSAAKKETGLPLSERRDIPHGAITPYYCKTIYIWAIRCAMSSNRIELPKYAAITDAYVPPRLDWPSSSPIPPNHPLRFGDVLIAWAPMHYGVYTMGAPIHSRLMKVHRMLMDRFSTGEDTIALIKLYYHLCEWAQRLREHLAPPLVRKMLMSSGL